METNDTNYSLVKAKCLACGLHFVLCTDRPTAHTRASLHCPECGQASGAFLVWLEEASGFIWQQVPGNAELWQAGMSE